MGTPTREEIKCMNPNYSEFKFPQIKPHPWHKVPRILFYVPCFDVVIILLCLIWQYHHLQIFHKHMPVEAVDHVSRLLQYSPNLRCTAVSIRNFDELYSRKTLLPIFIVFLPFSPNPCKAAYQWLSCFNIISCESGVSHTVDFIVISKSQPWKTPFNTVSFLSNQSRSFCAIYSMVIS